MTGDPHWRCGARAFSLGGRTLIMGIVNVTPDSFSGDGLLDTAGPDAAIAQGLDMAAAGADILDVGGESTRPGSALVTADEELARVVPVIEGLVRRTDVPVSVDTRKPDVARAALAAGASIVNDVGAAAAPGMFEVVREARAGLVLMHMQGEPKTTQDAPHYDDVVGEVRLFLAGRVDAAVEAGLERDQLCVDPGIGFGKNLEHNLALLRNIGSFRELGVPVLVGPSRKRFVGDLSGETDPAEREGGTAGAVAWCAAQLVDLVRVHDVGPMAKVLRVVDAIARDRARAPVSGAPG